MVALRRCLRLISLRAKLGTELTQEGERLGSNIHRAFVAGGLRFSLFELYFAIVIKVLEVHFVLLILIHFGNRFLSVHPFIHPFRSVIDRLALLPGHAEGFMNG